MWTLYLLSQHREVLGQVQNELEAVLGGRLPEFADLANLQYTRQVIDETLRLYPPAWAVVRSAVSDDVVGEWQVPVGNQITLAIAYIHRHPEFWEAPNEFRPERFAPEQVKGRHRFAYIPFVAGPRQCIGKSFALMEATLALATMLQQVEPRLVNGHIVKPKSVLTLFSLHGMPMQIAWR